jgi:asparagine synthase (glutamine-hydrolysing)
MCGIAGIVSVDHPDTALVRRMCDVLAHRGPDGAGYHESAHAALGTRRLAIIDVAGGAQPVYNEDRTVVAVFNGEIYNFRELRAELHRRGHRLATSGDSECLVHLYEEYADRLVDHLRGMFAFAVWDSRKRRLLLARDRVGKKPLYWRRDAGSLLFGSELKSLAVDPGFKRRVDLVALHHYLTYQYVPAPWSIYEGAEKLSPGHMLTWQDGNIEVHQYWRLDCAAQEQVTSVPEAAERLRELLLEATRIRMVSERPLGAFLSGGVDSSAVVAAMARSASKPVKTFSIGFDDGPFDERPYARVLATRYGTDHHELVVKPSALDVLPSLAWHFDEPFADSSAIPTFYVAQMSSQHVTVVLTGDGGDESFGGYERYLAMTAMARIPVPALAQPGLRRLGSALVRAGGHGSRLRRVGRALEALNQSGSRRYARSMSYFTPEQKIQVYTDELREQLAAVDSYLLLDQAFATSNARSSIGKIMDVDINTYLPGDLLAKVDITTMACSLEARSPFLDHHLMEWAAGLPAQLKIRRGTTKFLLKQAMAPWLPPELISRRKHGFRVPLATWLRTDFRELAHDVLTDATARSRGLFRPEAIANMLAEHDQGHDHASRLWALIQFELWHRAYVDPPSVHPTAPSRCPSGFLPT